uniref:Uncharacterized protein n=1 Tax=Triticum urartu TaxID=4572 RepID=A0A8R7U1P5_TRIUA
MLPPTEWRWSTRASSMPTSVPCFAPSAPCSLPSSSDPLRTTATPTCVAAVNLLSSGKVDLLHKSWKWDHEAGNGDHQLLWRFQTIDYFSAPSATTLKTP